MYRCNVCDYQSATKLGKCPSCGSFGSFEEIAGIKKTVKGKIKTSGIEIENDQQQTNSVFYQIENTELKRVIQNGVKQGGVYLLGGEPGIGKSTIVLQIISEIIKNNPQIKIGYFSGEESKDQVYQRLLRLHKGGAENIEIYFSTVLEDILLTSEINKFDIIIIDSIQTVYSGNVESSAGSAAQVRFCSEKITEFCKNTMTTGMIIGHVTKLGEIAGPKYLEHIVDVVLYLEGDRFGQYRFLRSYKNRFGTTDDVGIFEMDSTGLKPVYNIKDLILNQSTKAPGNILTVGVDNGRPVIVNVEVLLNKTKYKYPERKSIGVDINRLNLIIAILEKYLNINLGLCDIFVNIPGEFKFYDSGIDLAIAAAIYSGYKNVTPSDHMIFLGELGLGGQVIKSKFHEKRRKELPEGFEIIDNITMKNISYLKNIL